MIASLLPAFHDMTSIINHSYGNVLEWLVEVGSLEVLILTHLPPKHTSCLHCPSAYMGTYMEEWLWVCNTVELAQRGWASDFHGMYYCWTRRHGATARERPRRKHIGMNQNHLVLFFMAFLKPSALPPHPPPPPHPPADSMSPDRQKMLSFAPCVTSRANSIKIPSKEERWNCVMVVGALNLVMILSRGKWSCSANIMINSLQSTRCSFLHPPFPLPPSSTSLCMQNSVAIVNKAMICICPPPLPPPSSLISFSYNWRGLCVLSHTEPSEIGILF